MMERQSFQDAEKYPKQENGLPEDRFQNEVQTAVANQTNTKGSDFMPGDAKTGADSIVARTATVVKKKMAIKPVSDTNLSDSKIVGGVSLGDSAAVMSVAGAQGSGIAEDQSRVPYTKGGVRPNERYGKKISTDNFVINNVVSEQIDPSFDEPKDLRESPDSVQGYNGRKQFKTARGKKLYGNHPASTLFERSLDFNGHSAVIHATGQVIANIDQRSNYPKAEVDDEGEVIDTYFVQADKSNYLLKAMNITITNNHISAISFDEEKIVVPDPLEARDQANLNWQVDANNVAKAVIKMQTELGRETTDKWSPLGYIIDQPYEFGMLFHDGEAVLGALTGAAYKTAAHSLAYLQNKMAKEGVRGIPSIAEWMFEDLAKADTSTYYDTFSKSDIFPKTNKASYYKGSAAALIEMFDSTGKYATKADFINQPRSLKFHLQAVDNNINPFHAKKEFYKALDKAFLFSTDDGKYNPTLPIHVTDEVLIMLPYSLNAWLEGWKNPYVSSLTEAEKLEHGSFFKDTGIVKGCNYKYNDIRNTYNWEYVDPFVAGLCRWLLRHEAAVVKAYADSNGAATIKLPIHFTNTTANMFSFLVCSASQDMAWMRNLIFRDYLFAGEQGVYVWEDLASMKEINPLYSSQYQYKDYSAALTLGALSNVSKIRLYWPEYIAPREARYGDTTATGRENQPVASYYLPFYFNEEGIKADAASGIDPEKGCVMSYPLVRNGVNHEYTDIVYGLSERDVRLCMDRMVTVPVDVTIATGVKTGSLKGDKFHYSSLRYDANSDGRVIITCIPGENISALREWTYLATPRELGFLFPAPVNVLKPYVSNGSEVAKVADAYITGAYGEYVTSYFANGSVQSGTVIDRSASLSQSWIRCFADPRVKTSNNLYVTQTSMVPSISCIFDATLTESGSTMNVSYSLINQNLCKANSVYKLRSADLEVVNNISNANPSYTGNNNTFTIARLLWTIIQRKYNPINVFDCAWLNTSDGGATIPTSDGLICDPLEFAAYFGFAGTLASDFNQDVLNRLDIKDQLGMFYYEDEFIKSSLIFN